MTSVFRLLLPLSITPPRGLAWSPNIWSRQTWYKHEENHHEQRTESAKTLSTKQSSVFKNSKEILLDSLKGVGWLRTFAHSVRGRRSTVPKLKCSTVLLMTYETAVQHLICWHCCTTPRGTFISGEVHQCQKIFNATDRDYSRKPPKKSTFIMDSFICLLA